MPIVYSLEISSADLVKGLLNLSLEGSVAILDSCGSNSLGSHLLIAGIRPVETQRFACVDANETLAAFNETVQDPDTASIFTISYDFGRKLLGFRDLAGRANEPDIFVASFENLLVFDYDTGSLQIQGNQSKVEEVAEILEIAVSREQKFGTEVGIALATSNMTKDKYIELVQMVLSHIRAGYTYQTNLTQHFSVALAPNATPQALFHRLRTTHPAAFSAFISRGNDHVLSISPERFVEIESAMRDPRSITASPIKGTIKRGANPNEDERLKSLLRNSEKNRAENTMIVDLVRNDLGRICEYGTIEVEELCRLEEHPTLYHLVSTVRGRLRSRIRPSDVIKAVFPCGSITGCPKIKTMEIIDELEKHPRGLSMGAIGYSGFDNRMDMNVAIRTLVVDRQVATFNVGGGIVIDSDPAEEYRESMLKAKAIFAALNVI